MILIGIDHLYMQKCGRWKLRGLRPAGHPYRRLAQYLELNRRQPEWRKCIMKWAKSLSTQSLASSRRQLIDEVLSGVFPEGRADTLAINALFPLLQAAGNRIDNYWSDWPPGNRPDDIQEARQVLGLEGPVRNFEVQGILDILRRTISEPPKT
jgi:hypothetical protein